MGRDSTRKRGRSMNLVNHLVVVIQKLQPQAHRPLRSSAADQPQRITRVLDFDRKLKRLARLNACRTPPSHGKSRAQERRITTVANLNTRHRYLFTKQIVERFSVKLRQTIAFKCIAIKQTVDADIIANDRESILAQQP